MRGRKMIGVSVTERPRAFATAMAAPKNENPVNPTSSRLMSSTVERSYTRKLVVGSFT